MLYILQALLDGGADPRIVAEDGANPEQVILMHTKSTYSINFYCTLCSLLACTIIASYVNIYWDNVHLFVASS